MPTPEGPHHAKEVCDLCGRFVRWLPKPETLARVAEVQAHVEWLKTKEVTKWEQSFLFTLEKKGFKLSPKQQVIFDRMIETYE